MFLFRSAAQFQLLFVLMLPVFLSGCTTMGAVSTIAQVANFALGAAGVNKPADPNASIDSPFYIRASNDLNTDDYNHAFSVVIRVYQLKQNSAFQQAYYDIFLDPQKEKSAFGSDVVAVKEITLIPGQIFTNTEKISVVADYIGIVALFRTPAAKRWKLTFPTKDLNKTGIALGVSACSITVVSGTALEYSTAPPGTLKLPAANCG